MKRRHVVVLAGAVVGTVAFVIGFSHHLNRKFARAHALYHDGGKR